MVQLKADHDRAEVAELMTRFEALDCPGTVSYTLGPDAELRDTGNWSFAIVADFVDADAYRAYDADDEHNRLRARLGPMADQIARVQFEL